MADKEFQKNIVLCRISRLNGILLILASLFRALSVNNLVVAASTGDINSHFASSVIIDWSLCSMLLLLVGIWLLFLSTDLKNGSRKAWWQALLIGFAVSVFGAGFWYRYPGSLHLALFLALGLAILIPLFFFRSNKPAVKLPV